MFVRKTEARPLCVARLITRSSDRRTLTHNSVPIDKTIALLAEHFYPDKVSEKKPRARQQRQPTTQDNDPPNAPTHQPIIPLNHQPHSPLQKQSHITKPHNFIRRSPGTP